MDRAQACAISRRLFRHVLVLFAYVCIAWLGLRFATLHQQTSPVWPATGLAIAACTRWGIRIAPAIWLGAWLVNLQAGGGLLACTLIAFGNTCEALLGARIYQGLRASQHDFAPQAQGSTLAVAALLSSPLSATVGVLSLVATRQLAWSAAVPAWATWWMGDFLGALAMAPVLLSLVELRKSLRLPSLFKLVELAVLAALTTGSLLFILRHGATFLFLLFPLLLLCAARFPPRFLYVFTLFLYVFFCIKTQQGSGPFIGRSLGENLTHLQLFLAGLLLTSNAIVDFAESSTLSLATPLLLFGWLISSLLLYSFLASEQRRDQLHFRNLAQQAVIRIQHRMQEYQQVLLSGIALFAASETVTAAEWRAFIETLNLRETYPGLHGVGVIRPVPRRDVAAFLEQTRALGMADLRVHALSKPDDAKAVRDTLYIIQFVEPRDENQPALGLDIASETNRRLAAERARDSARPALTGTLTLVQDHKQRPGFLLLYPMYQRGARIDTVEARRSAFIAWVYSPFIAENWLGSILAQLSGELEVFAFAGSASVADALLYRSDGGQGPLPAFHQQVTIELAQQQLRLAFRRSPRFESSHDTTASWVAVCAALVTLLFTGLVVNLQRSGRSAKALVAERTQHLNEALAAAEKASRVKSQFLANMSHEIRTPLNGILGMSSLMLASPLTKEQREQASVLDGSSRALLNIVNDILDFSKIEAGKLILSSQPFSVQDCASAVLALFRMQAHEKGLALHLHIDPNAVDWIRGDATRYRQVLTNLVHNAIKFTSHGRIDVYLSSQRVSDGRVLCMTRVKDTGIGISETVKERLFRPFSQGDESTTRPYGGTGLGLSICKALVQAMGGEIDCDSSPGDGACFWFSIAAEPTQPSPSQPPIAERPPSSASEPAALLAQRLPLRILIADDQDVNQLVARRFLEKLGYRPDSVATGKQVLDALAARPYDVIFMDCHMPEMDGYAAAEHIRSAYPEAQRPKIIAMTASTLPEDRERCARVGMSGFVGKPIRLEQLTSALQTLFPERSATRS